MRAPPLVLLVLIGLLPPRGLPAGEQPSPSTVDYSRDVKPILSKRCYDCHGALKHKAGLRLDTAALMRKGGDSGPAVEPGQSDESLIVDAVTGRDGWRMPPESEGSPLSDQDIAKLKAWIDQGAKAPSGERPQPDPRDHWAFRTPRRPEVPSPTALGPRACQVSNPIDAFLAAEHVKHGLQPRPAADAATLIRRVTIDLTGLVPGPDEVRAFLADPSDRAYEALVDRLLASPQYGERWGRHWMDVWRYSDWDGFGAEVRESQPHIWRWRDWIVESLNRDMPYDRMIVAMLAADEAEPCDTGSLRATGFLVRNWYKFNRNVWLEDAVEHTAKAFLGMTLNCAKCHDHKYDPIPQTDYYAFRAFFEPHTVRTDRLPGQADITKAGLVRTFDGQPATPTFLFQRGDEKHPVKDKPLAPSVPKILQLQAKLGPISPRPLPAEAFYPGLTSFVRDEAVAQAKRVILAQKAALIAGERALADARDATTALKAQYAVALAKKGVRAAEADLAALNARIAADTARYARPPRPDAATKSRAAARLDRQRALLQAEAAVLTAEMAHYEAVNAAPKLPGDAKANPAAKDASAKLDKAREAALAARKAATDDSPNYPPLTPIYPAVSTGRRLALAHWITDPDNPLTARVAVNQIWMRHFGTPLVPSVFDFGRNGTPPAIPALLDWLAVQLRDEGWHMKPIHRLIVTSAAYRMQSTTGGPNDPNLTRDPANTYYWRMNPKRMEAEAVRDNVLYVAGSLDQTHGGPDIDPEAGLKSPRRSLYFRHAKEKRVTFLRLFDSPNVLSCYRRSESVAPQQALALANSSLCREQARLLAKRLVQQLPRRPSPSNEDAFVTAAFERVLGRSPAPEEKTTCADFLGTQARQLADRSRMTPFSTGPASTVPPAADPAQRAREDLVHVLLNHNDFVTIH
ncbi:MAG: DUF1553 domain-containing protein [Isosphaerales bacterium]